MSYFSICFHIFHNHLHHFDTLHLCCYILYPSLNHFYKNHSYLSWVLSVRLSQLTKNTPAIVLSVQKHNDVDPIANRLSELGFVNGETIRLINRAPFGGDPILVQVGFTRFALRLSEAERIEVEEVRI